MKGRVLILDDNVDVGQTIVFVAEAAGMAARSVSRPAEFFKLIEEWDPTHIVLDLIMPEMDGVEIMRHLARQEISAHIVILSGVGSRVLDAARRTASEKGLRIAGVLSKPVRASALQAFFDAESLAPDNGLARTYVRRNDNITAQELQSAIDNSEFQLVFQPKISCGTRKVAGCEALVRWNHPQRGVVMPDDFIPLAEKLNLIQSITLQIMGLGLESMKPSGLLSDLSLSINLSARTLTDLEFADTLARRCHDAGVDPDRLTLELTETTAMEDPILALDLVTRLRMKGFHVSIDDVGTGYSSMAQLARLPFSEMKVDKSFVMSARNSQESRTIIGSIVELGHNLELRVVAEGVEDAETLQFLEDIGCDMVQGFFIARPMPFDMAAKWILENR